MLLDSLAARILARHTGWDIISTCEPDPEKQVALARVRELHAQGCKPREIAARLNAEGVRTHKPNGRWHAANVARLLRRTDWSNYEKPSRS